MYIGFQGDKIKYYGEKLIDTGLYNLDRIEQTELEYVLDGDEYILKDEAWERKEAEKRKEDFETDFFLIPTYGWFRKKPKGYSSAVESLNTAFNAVSVMQQLPAGMLLFYEQPDFTDESQCTEEWLVAHQIPNEAMSTVEFGQFYVNFMTAWNNQEHITESEVE